MTLALRVMPGKRLFDVVVPPVLASPGQCGTDHVLAARQSTGAHEVLPHGPLAGSSKDVAGAGLKRVFRWRPSSPRLMLVHP